MGTPSRRNAPALFEPLENRLLMSAATARSGLGGKLGLALTSAYQTAQSASAAQPARSTAPTYNSALMVRGNKVAIIAYSKSASAESLAADIKKLGGLGVTSLGREVDALFPIGKLNKLAGLKSLKYAVPAASLADSGSVTSEGDAAIRANITRATTNLTGAGVVIGIISDSFNTNTSAATHESTDIATGDLPANVNVLDDYPAPLTDEGRAMAQVVYDSAPGATIYFETGYGGTSALVAAINKLRTHNPKIIIDDLTYKTESFFQDSAATQAISAAVASGITYLSAAGNFGTHSYGSTWRSGSSYSDGAFTQGTGAPHFYGGTALNFAPTGQSPVSYQTISLAAGQSFNPTLQWDNPYQSISGTGATSQVDIYLLDAAGTTVLNGSVNAVTATTNNGVTADPVQNFLYTNTTGATQNYRVMIVTESGTPLPGYVKYIDFAAQATTVTFPAASPDNGTIFGHANAPGALAVGAVYYANTPAYGVATPVLESNSSVGATPIFYTSAGVRQTPLYRQQPGVVAPDGVSTTFFGNNGSAGKFYGTSAAVAGAAGAAALVLQQASSFTPAQLISSLEGTALGFGATVPNYSSGYGLIRTDAAVASTVGAITGTVYFDFNGNGVFNSGETPIGGTTVYADLNNDGVLDAGDISAVSNGSTGAYTLVNVPVGTVTVRSNAPSGYITTTAQQSVTVTAASTTTAVNVGLFPTVFSTTGGGVSATLQLDSSNTSNIDIIINSTTYVISKALLPSLTFNFAGGNNTVTVNYSGNPIPVGGLVFNGVNTSNGNTLVINGTAGNDAAVVTNQTYNVNGGVMYTSNVAAVIYNAGAGNDTVVVNGASPTSQTFTFNGGTGNDALTINSALNSNGSNVILNGGTTTADTDTLNLAAGTYAYATDPSLTTANLAVNLTNASTLVFTAGAPGSGVNVRRIAALTINTGAAVFLPKAASHADRTLLVTTTVAITNSGIELNDNDMAVTSGTLAGVTSLVRGGFNNGSWTGAGIRSQAAATDPTHLTAVGVATGLTSLDGIGFAPSAVLLKYTYYGDANLDGLVDGSDYSRIDAGFLNGSTGWVNGDFNFDSAVDGTDYTLIDNAYNTQRSTL